MEETLSKLRNRFPTLPQDVLRKIYKCRLERMKTFMRLGLPEDIRWLIEAKVRLAGEFQIIDSCQGWEEVLIQRREEQRGWEYVTSAQDGLVMRVVGI